MPSSIIQWFPGHMAKTRRLMKECLPQVDIVIELLDARIPFSSRNPEIMHLVEQKPVLTLLNKASLADADKSRAFFRYLTLEGGDCLLTDCTTGQGIDRIVPVIREILAEKISRYTDKGMANRRLRAMVVGIPNVGKSSLINRLASGKRAKAENRPGVTVNKQWVTAENGLDLLDMPGVLWPKFDNQRIGENLAITGAIKTDVLNVEEIAMILCGRLRECAPALFCERYKLTPKEIEDLDIYDLFLTVGRKRGLLQAGGQVNERRTADMLLDEFRSAKIGRITLDRLPQGGLTE